jgi:hypothetical protein
MPLNKIKPQSPEENKVDAYGAPVSDYSATVLVAKMYTNPHEHIRLLWSKWKSLS